MAELKFLKTKYLKIKQFR